MKNQGYRLFQTCPLLIEIGFPCGIDAPTFAEESTPAPLPLKSLGRIKGLLFLFHPLSLDHRSLVVYAMLVAE